jgi:hypothetical protein
MVVVPTLLTSVPAVSRLIEHVEVLALGNLDPRIHFAILSDFVDAPAREMPGDEAILTAARAGIEALNARFSEGHTDRFFLFHRVRQWNPGESVWMGWERKRGKLEEWNRLLRGATDTSFSVQVGDVGILPSVRYCFTLDSDTRLPRDAAKKLIGIIAHPLNRPRFDVRLGRVTEGYGPPAHSLPAYTPATPESIPTPPLFRTPIKTCSARGFSRAKGSMMWTRSWPPSKGACPRTPSSRMTFSKGSTPARRSSRTWRWWTIIPRASSPMRGANTVG